MNARTSIPLFSLLLLASCSQSTGGDERTPSRGAEAIAAPASFFGISPDAATFVPADQASTLRALGVGLVRFQVGDWNDPNVRNDLDASVAAANAHGIAVLLELNYALIPVAGSDADQIAYWHAGFSDAGNEFSARFTAAAQSVAAHYGDRVSYYEIWNEPDAAPDDNEGDPLGGSPSDSDWDGACGKYLYGHGRPGVHWALCPRQLGVLTTNAFMAIKSVAPSAKIVAGNALYHGANGWVGEEYLRAFEASPAVQWHRSTKGRVPWDVVGIHPYYNNPYGALQARIAETRAIQSAAGDPMPLAMTEYGWETTHNADDNDYASLDDQAAFLRGAFSVANDEGLAFVMWFNYLSGPGIDFGVRNADGTWKPAARAYCEVAGATSCPAGGSYAPPPSTPPPSSGSGDAAIDDCVARNGGIGNVGTPFDNGGGAGVHRWGPANVQDFQGGAFGPNICVHEDGRGVAWMVRGAIRDAYFANGGAPGWLGAPVEDEHGSSIGEVQRFEFGFIGPFNGAYVAQPGDPPS